MSEPLEIKVTSDGVAVANTRLKDLTESAKQTEAEADHLKAKAEGVNSKMAELGASVEKASSKVKDHTAALKEHGDVTNSLKDSVHELAMEYLGYEAIKHVIEKTMEATVVYEKLQARLEGVEGSASGAREKFEELEKISDKTMATDEQMTEAYIQLSQRGLDPSSASLKAYANIAAATGKGIGDVAEMVSLASMGVYRGLRQIGVGVEKEGDQLKVTFRGQVTTIRDSSQSIQDYLKGIGEVQYAGAAERQLDTMGGSLKKLDESFEKLYRTIGESAIGDLIKTSIGLAADTIEGVTVVLDTLLSGFAKVPAEMDKAKKAKLDAFMASAPKEDGEEAVAAEKADKEAAAAKSRAQSEGNAGYKKLFEENARIMADKAAQAHELARKATAARMQDIADAEKQAALGETFSKIQEKVDGDQVKKLKESNKRRQQIIDMAAETDEEGNKKFEMDEGLALSQEDLAYAKEVNGEPTVTKKKKEPLPDQTDPTQKWRDELTAMINEQKTEREKLDDLYNHKKMLVMTFLPFASDAANKANADNERTYAEDKEALEKTLNAEYNAVRNALKKEEDVVRDSYEEKRKVITKDKSGDHTDTEKAKVLSQLKDKESAELMAIKDANTKKRDAVFAAYQTEEEALRKTSANQIRAIQEAEQKKLISVKESAALQKKEEQKLSQDLLQLDLARAQMTAANADAMFGNLSQAAKNWGGEQSTVYKELFAAQKAFSIASATMAMFQDIAAANAVGFPANVPLYMKAAADGAAVLASISSINYTGAHDAGGSIPAGSVGLVGERGPELVRGPASVTSRVDTAQALQGGRDPHITLINAMDGSDAVHRYVSSTQGTRTYLNFFRANSREIRSLLGVR
jgi:hypothetical protein